MNLHKSLLLGIDVQNDFCPGGALAVSDGDGVVEPFNEISAAFAAAEGRVALSQDWHPAGHISFASSHPGKPPGDIITIEGGAEQALWPDHCVQGQCGADFHSALDLGPVSLIVRKGFRCGLDSYSAFFENDRKTPTGLEGWMRCLEIETVIIGGLATDYCVFYSAMDAVKLGFKTIVLSDVVRGVGYPAGSVEKAIEEMKNSGIDFITSKNLLKEIG